MALDRRRCLQLTGSALFMSRCAKKLELEPGDSFDRVLDRIHETDVEFGGGLANHAPMAAEALVELGYEARVVPFVEDYSGRLSEALAGTPLSEAERASALGDFDRRAEWIAAYERDLESLSSQEVLLRDWAILSSGWAGAGWHGVLRTAHAVRSLRREDTPSRRRELAHALGYWAARHAELPGTPGAAAEPGLDVVSALSRVVLVPDEERAPKGLIYPQFDPLVDRSDYIAVIASVDLDAVPVEDALVGLTGAAARMFVHESGSSILLLHAITGTSALRLLLPWLSPADQRTGLGYAFQAVAGALAIATSEGALDPIASDGTDVESLSTEASESSDEHTIKLVEAAIREHRVSGNSDHLTAARTWIGSR